MRRVLVLPSMVVFALATTGFREPLTWPAPPIGAGAKVIRVPATGGAWGVPTTQDCDVRLPSTSVTGTVKVAGCRNVRIVGGELASNASPCADEDQGTQSMAALYVTNFAGTAHVEGVKIRGPGFSDAIWMSSDKPNSVGQVQGTWVGRLAACQESTSFDQPWPGEHPDCFQTWNGPLELRFDKNTCWTPYQGFYLDTAALPGPDGERTPARKLDIRRTNVHLDERSPNGLGCFMVWSPESTRPTNLERVHCAPGSREFLYAFAPRLDVDPGVWGEVQRGKPARGDEVTSTEAGIGYRRSSPGGSPRGGGGVRHEGRPAWLSGPDANRLVRSGRRAFRLRPALANGLRIRVRCLAACRVKAGLLVGRRVARRFHLGRGQAGQRVAGGRGTLAGRGKRTLGLRFERRARLRLRDARRVAITLRVVIRAGGARGVIERRLILRRG